MAFRASYLDRESNTYIDAVFLRINRHQVDIAYINGNSINVNSNEKIKIAVFSDEAFDARLIDDTTVELGDPVLGGTATATGNSVKDVDKDGLLDVVYDFHLSHLVVADAIDDATTELMLNAETVDGLMIFGTTPVTVK